jgi:arylsulfatase A-like enzyme
MEGEANPWANLRIYEAYAAMGEPRLERAMNILVIAIDTLRADHLSCYGHYRFTSPHLDDFAAGGVLFEECIAPHIPTHPGYTTLFTGVDAFTHQIVTQGGKLELSEKIPMLAEILQKRGYFTASACNMGRWFNRGYDVRESYRWSTDVREPWRKAEAVNEAAFRALDACAAQEKPWFCFCHYWDPHTPYLPPPPFDRMFYHGDPTDEKHTSALEMMTNYPAFQYYFEEWMPGTRDVEFPKAQYDAAIAYCDACLAKFFDRLREMPGYEETLVVVTADHGEELDEHQMWFDHHGLYDTNLHVPLIISCPERVPEGLRLGGLVRHLDVAPTILEFADLEDAAEEARMEGTSLVPLIEARNSAGTCDEVYITENAWMKKRGFRTKKYKFIESLYDELHHRPPYELYDLTTDPGEQNNLAAARPDLLKAFKQRLDAYIERRVAQTGNPDPQSYQDITLRSVGKNVKVAVPENQVLQKE